jgi:catechol 2,3-dioxygenase-like lactoylglutathione lyase family enzyme
LFDHVEIAVADLDATADFYRAVLAPLGAEPVRGDAEIVEWEDWDLFATDSAHPVSSGLHVGFRAPGPEAVDAFWRAGVDAGHRSDGEPGPRPHYGADYYGAFLLDPDGNSVEAIHSDHERPAPNGAIDHLWLRVADLEAARHFYSTIAPHAGLRQGAEEPGLVEFVGDDFRLALIDDERPPTRHVHIAFGTKEDDDVREFHAAAVGAGYEDNGGPGERPAYHPGYYGAFVIDPDGNNVEVVNHNRG